ncbi:DUF2182 domain-containing protein [Acidimangrovimonas pyrenivorans]|uniref:DUF2182 domain-containing protein n=1 Tax=Acidimangrovimonas pyrenivorans TaxID=2030798 RepID=A0ABV7AI46_9RHOB
MAMKTRAIMGMEGGAEVRSGVRPGPGLRRALWGGFFALVLAAWAILWLMAQQQAGGPGAVAPGFWTALCGGGAASAAPLAVTLMWAVMAAAMMAPTAAPSLRTYLDLGHAGAGGAAGFVALLAGYLAVWAVASLGFGSAQLALARAGLLTPAGQSTSLGLSAALCAVAGAYQFSRLKEACLSQCRAPLTFFLQHWRPGPSGALEMGLRLGAVCLGCCWALMGLAFVGGMANLWWMGLATLLMVFEKLPDLGRPLTRPLGVVLLAAAAALGGMALAS